MIKLNTATAVLKVSILAVVALFVFTVVVCIVWATVAENSKHKIPPNVWQVSKGFECTYSVWTDHYLAYIWRA